VSFYWEQLSKERLTTWNNYNYEQYFKAGTSIWKTKNKITNLYIKIYHSFEGFDDLLNETFSNECQNVKAANETLAKWVDLIYMKGKNILLRQCPIPCEQTVFDVQISYYHKNTFFWAEEVKNEYEKKQILYLGYETFDTEKHTETLIYNTGNFLTQVGGNLGLFLGFSFFSLILTTIECIKKLKILFGRMFNH